MFIGLDILKLAPMRQSLNLNSRGFNINLVVRIELLCVTQSAAVKSLEQCLMLCFKDNIATRNDMLR